MSYILIRLMTAAHVLMLQSFMCVCVCDRYKVSDDLKKKRVIESN